MPALHFSSHAMTRKRWVVIACVHGEWRAVRRTWTRWRADRWAEVLTAFIAGTGVTVIAYLPTSSWETLPRDILID